MDEGKNPEEEADQHHDLRSGSGPTSSETSRSNEVDLRRRGGDHDQEGDRQEELVSGRAVLLPQLEGSHSTADQSDGDVTSTKTGTTNAANQKPPLPRLADNPSRFVGARATKGSDCTVTNPTKGSDCAAPTSLREPKDLLHFSSCFESGNLKYAVFRGVTRVVRKTDESCFEREAASSGSTSATATVQMPRAEAPSKPTAPPIAGGGAVAVSSSGGTTNGAVDAAATGSSAPAAPADPPPPKTESSFSWIPCYDLVLDHDTNTQGHTQWFYFGIRNVRRNQTVRLRIVNNCKGSSLFHYGMKPLIWSEAHAKKVLAERVGGPSATEGAEAAAAAVAKAAAAAAFGGVGVPVPEGIALGGPSTAAGGVFPQGAFVSAASGGPSASSSSSKTSSNSNANEDLLSVLWRPMGENVTYARNSIPRGGKPTSRVPRPDPYQTDTGAATNDHDEAPPLLGGLTNTFFSGGSSYGGLSSSNSASLVGSVTSSTTAASFRALGGVGGEDVAEVAGALETLSKQTTVAGAAKGPRSNGISNNGAHRNPNGFYFTLSFDLTFEVSIGCSSSPADRGYCTAQNVPGHLPADISDVDVCDSPECVVLYLCVVHFTSAPLGESTFPSGFPAVLGAGRSSRSRTAAH